MKECKKCQDRLVEHCYGDIDSDSLAKVQAHLDRCGDCRGELERIVTLLGAIPREAEVGLDAPVRNRIRRDVRRSIQGTPVRRTNLFALRWMPTLASLLVVVFVGIVTYNLLPEDRPGRKGASHEELEVAEHLDILEHMEMIEILDALEEIFQPLKPDRKGGV